MNCEPEERAEPPAGAGRRPSGEWVGWGLGLQRSGCHQSCSVPQIVNTEIRLIIFSVAEDGQTLNSQQKQHQGLTVAQIMNPLLQNSDLN